MFFSAVDFRYFIKPCKRSAIQPVSQRRDEREAISLGLAIPTNATAFSKHKIYFIIKVVSLFAAPAKFFLLLYYVTMLGKARHRIYLKDYKKTRNQAMQA